ncbi:5-formyltetrahydrofolate cyclo-ligase [Natronosporangium hydrolyticum]|uniref:5-formyltetrahydrofolate cyclo-ligase n=1 Tax=Natronosporangium hydrolyticum TaxID=2811111 RepID=UPI001EFA2A63|nr:5-formyltetrahydrofolate cyclo-ligase [Natronosporangium hydrolyticum]
MSDSGEPIDHATSKAALRSRLLAARRQLTDRERATAAAAVQATLHQVLAALPPPARGGLTVTAYAPFGAEPGGADLPDVLLAALADQPAGGRLLLPVLRPDLDLSWARYEGQLAAGHRGMREPVGPRLGRGAVAEADLVLVPAVAVDQRGVRLGRGGGSYDRALARVPAGVPVLALLHDGELLAEVPAEPHDARVTGAVTPASGLVRTATGGSDPIAC